MPRKVDELNKKRRWFKYESDSFAFGFRSDLLIEAADLVKLKSEVGTVS